MRKVAKLLTDYVIKKSMVDEADREVYEYGLPNNTMYKRMTEQHSASEMLMHNGFISIEFSANLAVIKTRPGYASSLAYDIDNRNFDEILGTIAGDDTIMLVIREGCTRAGVKNALSLIIPNIQ